MLDFNIDGRTRQEVKEMKEYGYVEHPIFEKSGAIRRDGYFCGTCEYWKHRPHTMPVNPGIHDGFCNAYKFRDRDYGCCNGWSMFKKLAAMLRKLLKK